MAVAPTTYWDFHRRILRETFDRETSDRDAFLLFTILIYHSFVHVIRSPPAIGLAALWAMAAGMSPTARSRAAAATRGPGPSDEAVRRGVVSENAATRWRSRRRRLALTGPIDSSRGWVETPITLCKLNQETPYFVAKHWRVTGS